MDGPNVLPKGEERPSSFSHHLSMWEPLDLPLPVSGPSDSHRIPESALFLVMLKGRSVLWYVVHRNGNSMIQRVYNVIKGFNSLHTL